MASTWGDVLSQSQAVRQTIRVPLKAKLGDEITRLEETAKRESEIDKRENRDPVAPGIARRIQELQDEMEHSVQEFTFEALGRREYNKILAEHPPTDEQRALGEQESINVQFNTETFPPALMAASCVEPVGATVELMTNAWQNWSTGQMMPIWSTCLRANMGSADVGPKSQIASAILNGSAQN